MEAVPYGKLGISGLSLDGGEGLPKPMLLIALIRAIISLPNIKRNGAIESVSIGTPHLKSMALYF